MKALFFAGSIAIGVLIVLNPNRIDLYWLLVAVSSVLGVLLTISIGGADMPVVVALLNSYSGLILPLIASATATFLFRQFFLTVPDELAEAARVDGAKSMRFFIDILLPEDTDQTAVLSDYDSANAAVVPMVGER